LSRASSTSEASAAWTAWTAELVDRSGQDLHVRQVDLPGQEGLVHQRQVLQLLTHADPPPRLTGAHPQVVPQPGGAGARTDLLVGLGRLEGRRGLREHGLHLVGQPP
jgi:hypothetical protein